MPDDTIDFDIQERDVEPANLDEEGYRAYKLDGKFVIVDEYGDPVQWDTISTEVLGNAKQAGDDTTPAEIQQKLDDYPFETGGGVEFGPNITNIDQTLSLDTRRKLIGHGIASTRLEAADGLDDNIVEYINDSDNRWYFAEIRNLVIDGRDENNNSGHGIYTNDEVSDANDLYIENIMSVSCAEDGMHSDHSWGYRVQNSIFEFCLGRGFFFDTGTQNYLSDIFLQNNEAEGGEFRALRSKLKGIHANGNGGLAGLRLRGSENGLTNSWFGQNDSNGLEISTVSGGASLMASVIFVVNNGQDTSNSAANRAGVKVSVDDTLLSNVYALDTQDTKTQDRGVGILGAGSHLQNVHAAGNDTYGVKVNADNVVLSNITATNNQRGANIDGNNVKMMNANLTGNSGTDLYIGSGSDIELWNVTAESITDNGTRTRWNGVIGGGPLGGVDLSSTTGQEVGERAVADGTSGANAGYLARWTGSEWDVFQPATSVTPA